MELSIMRRLLLLAVALYGAALAIAGGMLVQVGGTVYYLFAGAGTTVAALLLFFRRSHALFLYLLVLCVTAVWALREAGLQPWLLLPRLGAPVVVGVLLAFLAGYPAPGALCRIGRRGPLAVLALAAILFGVRLTGTATVPASTPPLGKETEWRSFANDNGGARFARIGQITPANVKSLQVAWSYRTGEDPLHLANPRNLPVFEATPIKVGGLLYFCTPRSQVIAVDAESGREVWRHDPHANTAGASYLITCRGVAYAETPQDLDCPARIISATVDARLIALDARTGRPCQNFAQRGVRSLLQNLGPVKSGFYSITSAPLVANGVIVVGGLVLDGMSIDMPSGVIRAFDAVSGRQVWAFDPGADHPLERGEPPASRIYTRGSPNAWAPFSADEKMGLVFVPTGNASPDYFGGLRTPAKNRYSSSLLALDLATGELRWSFQTVHHDLWDYDVAAQPILLDIPRNGTLVPAVLQGTKRGDLFVLDRRSGKPLANVEERPVPKGSVAAEYISPTQPVSTGLPFLGPDRRSETSMWGITPFDQIWCRYKFRTARYEGPFTPPSLGGSLQSPNQTGASSWGRLSIDAEHLTLVANTVNLDSIVRLIPQSEADRIRKNGGSAGFPQAGTPYSVTNTQFISPLGVPCNAPPWGEIRAIDLATGQTLWKKPFGTTANRMPFSIGVPLGMPSVGGPLTTASGLTFIAAADDGFFRAYETRTGRLLWQFKLPAGGQAAPMTYFSRTGRQFVVIAAGGDKRMGTALGDYLVAFALPKEPGR